MRNGEGGVAVRRLRLAGILQPEVRAFAGRVSWIGSTRLGIGCTGVVHQAGVWADTDVVVECDVLTMSR